MPIQFKDGEILTAAQLNQMQAEYAPALHRVVAAAEQTSVTAVQPGTSQLMLNSVSGNNVEAASGGVRLTEAGVYLLTSYADFRHATGDAGARRDGYMTVDDVAGEIGRTQSTYPQQAESNRRMTTSITAVVPIEANQVVRLWTISNQVSSPADCLSARLNIVRVSP